MGIKHLNRFLREKCQKCINCVSLESLRGKKIAVDTSIYMYHYIGDNALIENFYWMISLFRYYDIVPIFVFDGEPPISKKEILLQRKKNKDKAEKQFNELKKQRDMPQSMENKQIIQQMMHKLRKKFIKIKAKDVRTVKALINACGVSYIEATGEADQLCAKLARKRRVYACLSEDMDMFAYGCPVVLRYFSLWNRTVILYDVNKIVSHLNLNQIEFRELCIISGTDYNMQKTNTLTIYNYYDLYNKSKIKNKKISSSGFYDWLDDEHIANYTNLVKTYCLFDLNQFEYFKSIRNISIKNREVNKKELKKILEADNFIFPVGI